MTPGALLLYMLPTFCGAILAAIGALYVQGRRSSQLTQASIRDLQDHVTRSTVTDAIMERDVSELKRTVPTIKEDVAVMANELANHLSWHERHNVPPA